MTMTMMQKLIGSKLGPYEIREKVGQGGMAQVFKAYHPDLDRFVAVKVLSPSLAEHPDFSERFQREAHSVAKLNHPNILQVYDAGIENNYNYIVMRYVENSTTLSEMIKSEVRMDQLINYVAQVADALNYAHQQGIIHRDIKPGNVLIDGKWALLADFGLVKMTEGSSELTSTGLTMGTPAYMSPEQAAGKQVDHRTDIYALGIILYKMLTGTVPHHAPTPLAIAIKRSTEPIPPLRDKNSNIPPDLERVILKALAIKPENRYSSAAQFATELQSVELADPEGTTINLDTRTNIMTEKTAVSVAGDATIASQIPVEGSPPSQTSQNSNLHLMIGGVVALLVLFALGWFIFSDRTDPDLDEEDIQAIVLTAEAVEHSEKSTLTGDTTDEPTSAPTDTPPTPMPGNPVVVANTDLDIYFGPGEFYDIVGGLSPGNSVKVIGRDRAGEWWQIETPTGIGWITADEAAVEVDNVDNVIIAIAPDTPTPTPTDTSTPEPDTPTPTETNTSTPEPDTPTPTETNTSTPEPTSTDTSTPTNTPDVTNTPRPPTRTPTPDLPDGQFVLLKPTNAEGEASFGMTTFEWQWSSPLKENQGFEVRVWREGGAPAGVHNSVNDNKNGVIKQLANNTYRLTTDITESPSVNSQSGDYFWTVLLVEIAPSYKDLGIQADTPGTLRYNAPGPSGGDDGDGGGGGDGGGLN
ncbi:serine/threonine protein kinase [Anaerolineales bacterium HSG24]|nr:serine/threonine protein kinase [Anaerolineales bacterium HSG24]